MGTWCHSGCHQKSKKTAAATLFCVIIMSLQCWLGFPLVCIKNSSVHLVRAKNQTQKEASESRWESNKKASRPRQTSSTTTPWQPDSRWYLSLHPKCQSWYHLPQSMAEKIKKGVLLHWEPQLALRAVCCCPYMTTAWCGKTNTT